MIHENAFVFVCERKPLQSVNV